MVMTIMGMAMMVIMMMIMRATMMKTMMREVLVAGRLHSLLPCEVVVRAVVEMACDVLHDLLAIGLDDELPVALRALAAQRAVALPPLAGGHGAARLVLEPPRKARASHDRRARAPRKAATHFYKSYLTNHKAMVSLVLEGKRLNRCEGDSAIASLRMYINL